MAKIIGLPKLSPTMDEGTLARWLKKEGDPIEVDEVLAEVETDKATMEFRSFDKGVLLKILAPEGTTLAPDAPVMIIGAPGEDVSGLIPSSTPSPIVPVPPPTQEQKGEEKRTEEKTAIVSDGRVLASPLVRRLARERDLDLHGVAGTGPHGRIIKRDLDGLPEPSQVTQPLLRAPVLTASPEDRVEKLSQMRKTIARRLTESKQTVPHFYLTIDLDADPLWSARGELNAALEKDGEKISVNDLVIKACAQALRLVPAVNASFTGDAIRFHGGVHVSVAVAVPDGLFTPVIRDADQKGVLAIAREVKALAARAKEKKLKPEEMTGGTFSVSNLGMFDVESFAAVINPPEGAILAVGSVREEPVVRGGAVVPGRRMRVTMSCDHRVVDGALGARWLQALRGLLEHPITLVL